MKKIRKNNNIYDKELTIDNLYKMWNIIKKTCKNKKDLYYFSLNLNTNIMNIYNELKTRTYIPTKYKTFMIFEPKPRLVMSQIIKDKLINHFIANYYLLPLLESKLIDSNIATRKGKGSSYAMKLIKKYFNSLLINSPNQEIYCLKIDISKYFYSIDHNILLNKLEEYIKDKEVINLIRIIISETNNDYINKSIKKYNKYYNTDIPYYINNKGLSIGAMTSQFLAIFFLNDLDHYIKEQLKCSYYIRYMDDLLILDTNKEKLKQYFKIITIKIETLKLKVNNKSNIHRSSKGISFLGYNYKIINNKLSISCKKETFLKIRKKLKYLEKTDTLKYKKSLNSYYGYFETCKKIEREKTKMTYYELYNAYKSKEKNTLVIIKDKNYYKTYQEDAKILWYLYNYKYNGKFIYFRPKTYDKVLNTLKNLNINYIIVNKSEKQLTYISINNNYKKYLDLANKEYILFIKIKQLLDINPHNCKIITKILNKTTKNSNFI